MKYEIRFNGARFFWNREAVNGGVHVLGIGQASMGPGSFGTGKPSGSARGTACQLLGFNGARFFWNREVGGIGGLGWLPRVRLQWGPVLLEPGSPGSSSGAERTRICFNGARFFWNREGSWACVGLGKGSRASMGPGSFGTGKPMERKERRGNERSSFNGARFFWNREGVVSTVPFPLGLHRASMGPGSFGTGKLFVRAQVARLAGLASMGPGSFGTGKKVRQGGAKPPTFLMLQWGPVLLEPGSHWRGRASDECNDLRCFNGARFFWNREVHRARRGTD